MAEKALGYFVEPSGGLILGTVTGRPGSITSMQTVVGRGGHSIVLVRTQADGEMRGETWVFDTESQFQTASVALREEMLQTQERANDQ